MTNNAAARPRKGQVLESGFEILDVVDLAEFEAEGIWARHVKTGAEVFHVLNDDAENLFSFTFTTPPEDSTGVAHILEHSVLCGSEAYPLKDAFLVLAQGSLQTYLNAWTFPDKTIYPASSVNERDYFNLMAVYGDAVFRPLLSEWTFMQEAHRLVFPSSEGEQGGAEKKREELKESEGPKESEGFQESGGLQITGVVYNEMKGAYSSLDAYAGLWSVKSLLPDTPYDFESGGDPDCIPDLTWEGLKEFHRARYSPSNCRIFLAGNIPTEKQLAFLNEKFFSRLPPGNGKIPLPKAERWKSPRSYRIPCPSGAEQKPTALLAWLCGDAADADETLALAALTEILLGHDGSPLTRLLIDSGLGEDLSPVCGLEGEMRETSFCAGIRGLACADTEDSCGDDAAAALDASGGADDAVADGSPALRDAEGDAAKGMSRDAAGTALPSVEEAAKKVEELILRELSRLEREGIPKEEIEAALLGMEFSQREIRRSGGPFSLVWMRRSLRSWLHGGTPWDSLVFARPFAELKRRVAEDGRCFEKMIRRYFLDNPHRAFIIIEPKEGFLEEKEAALAARLGAREAAMGKAEKEAVIAKAAALLRAQEQEDSPEALAAIPHLSRADLSPEIEIVKRDYAAAKGAPLLLHPLFTNGISYVDLAFPLDIFAPEDYLWFPFFARTAVSMGLPGMDYGEVSSLLARTSGGFHALLHTASPVPGASRAEALPTGVHDVRGRDWIIFRLKALDEKIAPSLDLAQRLITGADFSDVRRLRDLVLEMKNDLDSSLAPSGHSYASGFSGRLFSRSRMIDELWSGFDQILFAHKLAALDVAETSAKLKAIQAKLTGAGVLVNYTGGAVNEAEREIGNRFGSFGPPRPANSQTQDMGNFLALSEVRNAKISSAEKSPVEIFSSPSLQVGFAAMSVKAAPFGSSLQAAELALSHQLSTGALWEDIRMKGGAYGAFAQGDHLEGPFLFSTYRDPSPARSLEAFASIIGEAAAESGKGGSAAGGKREDTALREDALDKAVIGAYAKETRPRTPAEKGLADFLRFLSGIEDRHRALRLKDLIAVDGNQIDAALKRLAAEVRGSGETRTSRNTPAAEGNPERDESPRGSAVIIAGKTEAEKAAARFGVEVRNLPV